MCNRVLVFCLIIVWVNSFLFQKWVQGWQPCMVGCSTNWCVGIAKQAWTCTAVCYAKERGSIARQEGGNILHIWWNVSIVMIRGFYGDTSTDVCWKSACIWIFGSLKHVTDNVLKKKFERWNKNASSLMMGKRVSLRGHVSGDYLKMELLWIRNLWTLIISVKAFEDHWQRVQHCIDIMSHGDKSWSSCGNLPA